MERESVPSGAISLSEHCVPCTSFLPSYCRPGPGKRQVRTTISLPVAPTLGYLPQGMYSTYVVYKQLAGKEPPLNLGRPTGTLRRGSGMAGPDSNKKKQLWKGVEEYVEVGYARDMYQCRRLDFPSISSSSTTLEQSACSHNKIISHRIYLGNALQNNYWRCPYIEVCTIHAQLVLHPSDHHSQQPY